MLFAKLHGMGQASGAMKVSVFHPGTQHSRLTALALQDLGRLAFLATGLFAYDGDRMSALLGVLPKRLAEKVRDERSRFAFPALDPALVRTFPAYELPERLAMRMGSLALAHRLDRWGNAAFGRRIAKLARRERPFALWGYNGSSATAFTDPRCEGLPRILDRTIADGRYWNMELACIRETHADWLDGSEQEWSSAQIAQDEREYGEATHIVCGSEFAAKTVCCHAIAHGTAAKVSVLPYCFDEALFGDAPVPIRVPPSEPVRFLFVGQVGVRKGIHHLLAAFECIPPGQASLTIVGPVAAPGRALSAYADRVDFVGPVPRHAMPALMQGHHVLVLPSHFEGSAVVLPEAMASGLALIHTEASGFGASEESGVVLDYPTAEGVEAAMVRLVADRDLLQTMREAALRESAARNFAAYREHIGKLLERLAI